MRIFSRLVVQNTSRKPCRVSFMKFWNEAGALVRPNGMILYLKWSYQVRNAIILPRSQLFRQGCMALSSPVL